MSRVSVVVPVYCNAASLPDLFERLTALETGDHFVKLGAHVLTLFTLHLTSPSRQGSRVVLVHTVEVIEGSHATGGT